MSSPRLLLLPAAAALVAAAAVPALAAPTAPAALALPSVTPAFAAHAPVAGAVDGASRIDFSVVVAGKDDAAITPLAKQLSDPASPLFRHFLSKSQREAMFDPSAASTAVVVAGLKALGLTVDKTTEDGRVISVHGTASLVSSALGIRFAMLRTPTGAVERVAMNQPVLTDALKPLVGNVFGLSATPVKRFTDVGPISTTNAPAPAFYAGKPCSAYYGATAATGQPAYQGKTPPRTVCGYDAAQLRAAYRIPQSGLDGKGTKIGIVDDYSSPTMVADTDEYSKLHGVTPLADGQYVDNSDPAAQNVPETVVNDDDPVVGLGALPGESPQEWSGEQSLDVEMVHLMAPAATIEYYGGDQGIGLQPLEAEFSQAIAMDAAQFLSDSWGTGEESIIVTPADEQVMAQELGIGAVTGIGASFSSGDDGDDLESTGTRDVSFPADTDMATAVGGTTLVVGKNNTYVGETYWGTRLEPLTKDGKGWDPTPVSEGTGTPTGPGSLAGGGGGGVSSVYAEPDWQKPVVPASLTTQTDPQGSGNLNGPNNVTTPGRVVPDISLEGDSTTGVLVGQTQTQKNGTASYSEFRIGGTSVSSPLFGGLMALAIQKNGGASLGFVSPALYSAYKSSPLAFRDPSLGRGLVNVRTDYTDAQDPKSAPKYALRLLGQLSTLHDLKGYDDSTGLGTPCAPTFVAAVVAPTRTAAANAICGAAVVKATPVTVTPPKAAPKPVAAPVTSLPTTGLDGALPLTGLVVVAGAGGALLLRRRYS